MKRSRIIEEQTTIVQEFFEQCPEVRRPASTEGYKSPHLNIAAYRHHLYQKYKAYRPDTKHLKKSSFYNLLNSPLFKFQHSLTCLCSQCHDGYEAFEFLITLCGTLDGTKKKE